MFLKYIYFAFFFSYICCQEWLYQDQRSWRRNFRTCGGRRQSPIVINSNQLRRNPSLRLNLNSYEIPHRNVIIHNTGHTAEMTLNSRNPSMEIEVGKNAVPYVFQNMHIHWGSNNFEGTEHSIDDNFGSAELHFVHYNKKYGSLSAAQQRTDGILVVTTLLQLSRENNRALEPFIKALPQIIRPNASAIIHQFNFGTLLPRNKQLFFSYPGSLTTPPCSETVTFLIFADPIRISAIQLSQFRRLFEVSNGREKIRLISNRRRDQPLNGRIVEISVPRNTRILSQPEPEFNLIDREESRVRENFIDYDI